MALPQNTNYSHFPHNHDGQSTPAVAMEKQPHRIVSLNDSTPTLLNSDVASVARFIKMHIQNYSDSTATVFIGESDVTSAGARRGIELLAGGFLEHDITNAIPCYAISKNGDVDVMVQELF